jgi:hypothetical protein
MKILFNKKQTQLMNHTLILGDIKNFDILDVKQNPKEMIISAALDSPEGREALVRAMVEPIKTSLSYQGIGRRLLMIDELPDRDSFVQNCVIPCRKVKTIYTITQQQNYVPSDKFIFGVTK